MPDTLTPIPERLALLDEIDLKAGDHSAPEDPTCTHPEGCAEEIGAWIMGLDWTDSPETVSPVIAAFMRRLNDGLPDDLRQQLKPYLVKQHGTADDGRDEERGWMAADWSIRVAVPTWLGLAGANEAAEQLRELPEVNAMSINTTGPIIREIRNAMWEKRKAAREALREKVLAELKRIRKERGEEVDAAAADAAAAAAATADADAAISRIDGLRRRSAIWDAVYSAVRGKLEPIYEEKYRCTQTALLPSALGLLDRMIEVGKNEGIEGAGA